MGSDKTDVAVAPSTKKKSDDRFYLMEMANRPAKWGDIGNLLRIEGLVIGGGGAQAVLFLPDRTPVREMHELNTIEMSIEEWSDWLRYSDDPQILVGPTPNGSNASLPKIWARKLRYEVSGAVQQKVWAADRFKCYYCGAKMGDALLTVDHFEPLENGGKNDPTNFLTACRRCNKDKGSEPAEKFCERRHIDFEAVKIYLASRKIS